MTSPAHTCHDRCNLIYAMVEAATTDPDWTLQAIADEFDFSRQRAEQILQEHEWKLNRAKRGTTCKICTDGTRYQRGQYAEHAKAAEHDRETAAERMRETRTDWDTFALAVAVYEAGYTAREMEEVLPVPAEHVYRFLGRIGMKPNRGGFNGHYDRTSEYFKAIRERQAETLALLDSGTPAKEVAELLKMNKTSVYSLSSRHKARHKV